MFKQGYKKYFFFDVETTGLSAENDQIIEFAYVLYNERFEVIAEVDHIIKTGVKIPELITELTGITEAMVAELGVSQQVLYDDLKAVLDKDTILIAYNTTFDIKFLYYFMRRYEANYKISQDIFDVLAVYRDRRPYPHKLANAIPMYHVKGENTHRAIDDIFATAELFKALAREQNNFKKYINSLGFFSKYGIDQEVKQITTYAINFYEQAFDGEEYIM